MDNVVIQYVLIGLVVAFVLFTAFKKLKNTFSKSKKDNNCGDNCGCS